MSEPMWQLTGDYGVSIDPLNWKLMQKAIPKEGGKPNWKVVGYYRTPEMLAEGMQRKIMRTYTDNTTLKAHLESTIDTCQAAVSALKSQLNTIGAGANTLPPGYAKFGSKAA